MATSKFHTGSNRARDALNTSIQAAFRDWFGDIEPDTNLQFVMDHLEHGTNQWSDRTNCNVCVFNAVCPHMCLYCYAALNAINKFGVNTKEIREALLSQGFDIFSLKKNEYPDKESIRPRFQLDPEKLARNFMTSANPYLIMLPSSHDVFPETLDQAITVTNKRGKTITYTYIGFLRSLMDAGHELLITLKPRLDVVKRLCEGLEDYKALIVFRFTITSNDPVILAFWETFAPDYDERMASLRHAHDRGFRTTVSMEPYLTDPRPVIEAVKPFAAQIWLGYIDRMPQEKLFGIDITTVPDVLKELARLRQLYAIANIKDLVMEFLHDDKIFLKSSIIKAIITSKTRLHAQSSPGIEGAFTRLEEFLE